VSNNSNKNGVFNVSYIQKKKRKLDCDYAFYKIKVLITILLFFYSGKQNFRTTKTINKQIHHQIFQYVNSLLQEENRNVGIKLLKATIAMFTMPIITFYIVYNVYIQQNSILITESDNIQIQQQRKVTRTILDNANTYGGIAAVVCANIIIAIYCYYAYIEDTNDSSQKNKVDDTGKVIPPRVGTFQKTRVD
jgi:VMA21-like domain